MSLEDVIKAGEGLTDLTELELNTSRGVIAFAFVFFGVIIGFNALTGLLVGISEEPTWVIPSTIALILCIVSVWGSLSYTKSREAKIEEIITLRTEQISEWRKTQAYPYIKQQEYVKQELQQVIFKEEVDKSGYMRLILIYTDPTKGNKVSSESDTYEVSMTLPEDTEPYMMYYNLKDDLGNNIKAGKYFKVIYLPKNFKFSK